MLLFSSGLCLVLTNLYESSNKYLSTTDAITCLKKSIDELVQRAAKSDAIEFTEKPKTEEKIQAFRQVYVDWRDRKINKNVKTKMGHRKDCSGFVCLWKSLESPLTVKFLRSLNMQK